MQLVSSRIWTRVAVSISYDDNHYTTGTFCFLFFANNFHPNNFLLHPKDRIEFDMIIVILIIDFIINWFWKVYDFFVLLCLFNFFSVMFLVELLRKIKYVCNTGKSFIRHFWKAFTFVNFVSFYLFIYYFFFFSFFYFHHLKIWQVQIWRALKQKPMIISHFNLVLWREWKWILSFFLFADR